MDVNSRPFWSIGLLNHNPSVILNVLTMMELGPSVNKCTCICKFKKKRFEFFVDVKKTENTIQGIRNVLWVLWGDQIRLGWSNSLKSEEDLR